MRQPNPILRPHIRWMIRRDLPEVLRIENAAFPFPWSESDFLRCLRQRNTIGMSVEYDDRFVGFLSTSYIRRDCTF
jgi:ribosomal-protein-alanine N-acetyltransferase